MSSSINNDTADENEKVRRPLLTHSTSPNQSNSPRSNQDAVELDEVKFHEGKTAPVKDTYSIIYFIFLLFGIATLLPWNVFINSDAYFTQYKLNTNESANATYRLDFTLIVGSIGQSTNVLMNIINILVNFGGNPKNRIPYALLICAASIFFHIVLAIVDSSTWPLTFFILCCISVFVMYIGAGILNSCVYYVASMMPMEYINAIILGNNLSGIFTSVMSIISKITSPNLQIAAIYYFSAAFVALILAFCGYFLMHKMSFFKYHEKMNNELKAREAVTNNNVQQAVPYGKILKKIWLLLFCIWLNFVSTLSVFPVFQLGVQPNSKDFIVPNKWFQDIVTFLTFNVLVTIGNLIPKLIRRPGPKWIPVFVIARAFIVITFFLFSNFQPNTGTRTLPVYITNDYVYWAGCALSPLIFGYFTSLLMMYTPQQVDPEHAGTAAMLSALVLVIGVVSGLQSTTILEAITKL